MKTFADDFKTAAALIENPHRCRAGWTPPSDVTEMLIFGDNDALQAGEKTANSLVSRIATMGLKVAVHIPPTVGDDWNDALLSQP